jgi:hypothetical protein
MPYRELDLTVWKLPPVFDDSHVSGFRESIEDFAGLQASGTDRQREFLGRLGAGHRGG